MTASPRRKAFGQHFLRDAKIIQKIIKRGFQFVSETQAQGLLEIGPGKGALTQSILIQFSHSPSLKKLTLVELDQKFSDHWKAHIDHSENKDLKNNEKKIQILSQDFLNVEPKYFLEKKPLVVISNLPYASGTAILNQLANFPKEISGMILMFQAEVARRLYAQPSTKAWGSLSLWIQNQWDVQPFCPVPPHAFSPPPDVQSEVITLTPRKTSRISMDPSWIPEWEKLLRAAFAHRRKMLRSGLPKNSIWLRGLEKSGIDPTLRAEALDWGQWTQWVSAIQSLS